MHHLDTDTVISLLRGNRSVAERLKGAIPHAGISTLVLAELNFGVRASRDPDGAERELAHLLPALQMVPFDDAAAVAYGHIRYSLKMRGLPIGDIDTLIAAVAVANRATLVTHNRKHFNRVATLSLEDWTL